MLNDELSVITDDEKNKIILFCDDFDNAIVCRDLEGIVTSFNKGAEELYGYKKDQIIGKSIFICSPKVKQKEFEDMITKINSGEKVEHFETLRKKKNGEIISVIISTYPITHDGKVIGSIGISRDAFQKEVYKLDIFGKNFGVWDWEIKTNKSYYSNTCKEMLGYDNREIGYNFRDWFRKIHNEDRNFVLDKFTNYFNGEDAIEYRLKCKDGHYKWIRTRASVIKWDSEGTPLMMRGTNEDISREIALKLKVEEDASRIIGIYNSITAGVALGEINLGESNKPINFKCLQMNQYMQDIMGPDFENISFEDSLKLLPEIGKNWFELFAEVALKGKLYSFEDYNEVMEKYYNIKIYSPKKMQFSMLITDITEIKKREIDLVEKYEELQVVYEELSATEEELRTNYLELEKVKQEVEDANKAKTQFLANMSHELRTPLNGIIGCAQLLNLSELSEEQDESVKIIGKSSDHLLKLVNDILDLAKIEFGKVEIYLKKFNFIEFMDYVIKDLNLLVINKNIEIIYYIDPFISRELIGDNFRLKQVLNNLMSNAVKFTDFGHIYLKVIQIGKTVEETELKFIVEDTGKGITKDFKSKIFNKFTQEELSYTKKYGGTGLGLAISKELVKLMGGDIGFESKENNGSTFYFTSVFKNSTDENNRLILKENSIRPSKKIVDKNILIVEDNEINMKIAKAFLKELNCKYICAHNGKEALDYLESNKVDIILMDVQMPILNGYDATKIIREKEIETGEHKIIIAQTAYAMEGDRKKFIDCGMDDYISKPYDIETLADVLSKY